MLDHVIWRSNDVATGKNICPKTFAPDCIIGSYSLLTSFYRDKNREIYIGLIDFIVTQE